MIERYEDLKARNWWVRTTVTSLMDTIIKNEWIKGEKLVYFRAAMKLILEDMDGFVYSGFDMSYIQFYAHERKGSSKKLVSVKARWTMRRRHD